MQMDQCIKRPAHSSIAAGWRLTVRTLQSGGLILRTTPGMARGLWLSVGELAALEEIVGALIRKQPEPLLKPIVVKALTWLAERAHQQACTQVETVISACWFLLWLFLWPADAFIGHKQLKCRWFP